MKHISWGSALMLWRAEVSRERSARRGRSGMLCRTADSWPVRAFVGNNALTGPEASRIQAPQLTTYGGPPVKFELDDYHRNMPDADLLDDVRRVAREMAKPTVTIDQYNELGKYHATTLIRRFGSWFSTLDKAGLGRTRNLGMTEDELFENLENLWISLGRQPRYGEVRVPASRFSAGALRFATAVGGRRSKPLSSL